MSRQTIKTALYDALVAAGTAAGSNIDLERADPWPEGSLPAITIVPRGEAVEYTTQVPARTRLHQFQLQLVLDARETSTNRCDQVLDALLDEIDAALTDHTLGGTCRDLHLGDLEYAFTDAGQYVSGSATQTLTITYTTTEP